MNGDKELLIKIRADIRQSLREMQRMTKEIRTTGTASEKSSKQVASMGKAMTFLKRGAAAYLSLRLAKALVLQADDFNTLQARIKTATRETGDYVEVSKKLFSVSQQNGSSLESSVSLFQRLALSAKALGATNKDIITVTDTVQKLGVIGGSSTAAMAAGTIQFGQALSSGTVHAEEINSVIENMPELAVRIEKSLKLLPGTLKNAVVQGKVLSRDVFQALLRSAPEVAKEFESIPDSVRRSSQSLSNSFDKFLSQLDSSIGLTQRLASLFRSLSDELAGTGRTTAQIRKDIEALRQRGPSSRLGGQADFKAGLRRLENELNAALEKAGGIGGIRLKLQNLDDQIAQLDSRLEISAGSRNRRAAVVIQTRLTELKRQKSTLLDALASAEFNSGGPAPKKTPSGPTPDQQQLLDSNNKIVSALQLQAATFGKTSEQIALYRLELNGATPAQLKAARAAIDSTNAMRDQVSGLQAEIAAEQALTAAQDDRNQQLKQEGQQVIQDTLTAQEQLNQKLAHYRELLNAGTISQDVYDRAKTSAQQSFQETADSGDNTFAQLKDAGRQWGDSFTNTLADIVTTGKGNFKDLADSIIKDLARIAIRQAITKPLLAAAGIPAFASGGPVVGPGTATSDSIQARLSAGEYVIRADAVRAYSPQFLEAINQMRLPRYANVPPITISRPGTHFASGGLVDGARPAGDVKVEIVNNGQPARVTDTQVSVDPKDFIIRVMIEDQNSNGPAITNLQSTFGLRRSPR